MLELVAPEKPDKKTADPSGSAVIKHPVVFSWVIHELS